MLTSDGTCKYVCPDCKGDNVAASGMGERYLHCFGHCMMDIRKEECPTVKVTPDEAEILRQEPY